MNVSLTPEFERFVAELVSSGRYRSASEVIRDALRLLHEAEAERAARLEGLRSSIDAGLAELDGGKGEPAEDVFRELLERVLHERQDVDRHL